MIINFKVRPVGMMCFFFQLQAIAWEQGVGRELDLTRLWFHQSNAAKGKRGAEVEGVCEELILSVEYGRRRGHSGEGPRDNRP